MKQPNKVHILVLSGSCERAVEIASNRYAGCSIHMLSKRELREGGWKRQLHVFLSLKGQALIIFVNDRRDIQEMVLTKLAVLFHGCRETLIADSGGAAQMMQRTHLWKVLPVAVIATVADALVLAISWIALELILRRVRTRPRFCNHVSDLDVAYLYPFPMDRDISGGAISHVKGFLSGLSEQLATCEILSGRPLPFSFYPVRIFTNKRLLYLFRESQALSYNLQFVIRAREHLRQRRPKFLYQRHGKFSVAGALLSRLLRRPLALEYNGSEVWITKHWDPTRFRRWLKLCEEIALAAATVIVVVSEPSKQELIDRGIASERILVNPNAVDPVRFRPNCGGREIRRKMGFRPDHAVAAFIGTFGYYHGLSVLREAIQILLEKQKATGSLAELRFLLIGDGALRTEVEQALDDYTKKGWVVFTGQISHELAPAYLDSADMFISPHIQMPDGKPFFGSPTKLFEYMAMEKAIIASNLDQLAAVLKHQQTAWLVTPGDPKELAEAICLLTAKPEVRGILGRNAREIVVTRHTWRQNAARVLHKFTLPDLPPVEVRLNRSEA